MAYAYKPLHVDGLAHAFTNTLLYLDWDRRGFPWPVLPFAINCYGRNLIHAKGGMAALFVPPSTEASPIRRRRSPGAAWMSAARSPRCSRNRRGGSR